MLYGLSNLLFILLYYVFKYRRKVTQANLRNSFPLKSNQELALIEKRFYKHLVDVMLETLKLLTIRKTSLVSRVQFSGIDVVTQLQHQQKGFIIVLGHMGNWEWSGQAYAAKNFGAIQGLYHPLSNGFFNWMMIKLRTRFGLHLIPMNSVLRELTVNRNKIGATAFIADQTPTPDSAYWVDFLNQKTAVFMGTEKIARKFRYPVVYASCRKPKRGHYLIKFELITSTPERMPEGWLTAEHTKRLENDIQVQPEIWLWSHRRWKHSYPTSK